MSDQDTATRARRARCAARSDGHAESRKGGSASSALGAGASPAASGLAGGALSANCGGTGRGGARQSRNLVPRLHCELCVSHCLGGRQLEAAAARGRARLLHGAAPRARRGAADGARVWPAPGVGLSSSVGRRAATLKNGANVLCGRAA